MSVKITFDDDEYLKGLNEITEKLQEGIERLNKKNSQGFVDALMFVANESQQRAPVDTGDLRGSVQVEVNGEIYAEGEKIDSDSSENEKIKIPNRAINVVGALPEHATTGVVSFNAKYAATQHEQINYDHPRGGQSKYLESVLVEEPDRILQLIANGKVE